MVQVKIAQNEDTKAFEATIASKEFRLAMRDRGVPLSEIYASSASDVAETIKRQARELGLNQQIRFKIAA